MKFLPSGGDYLSPPAFCKTPYQSGLNLDLPHYNLLLALRTSPTRLENMRIVKPAPKIPGTEVREFRRDLNWNQERLAQLLGVSKPYVQKIESAPDPISAIVA